MEALLPVPHTFSQWEARRTQDTIVGIVTSVDDRAEFLHSIPLVFSLHHTTTPPPLLLASQVVSTVVEFLGSSVVSHPQKGSVSSFFKESRTCL